MKKCLYCAEEIQDEAIKCKYCFSELKDTRKPETPSLASLVENKEPQSSREEEKICPISLKIIAWLYILVGGISLIGVIIDMFRLVLFSFTDIGVIALFIGAGLLRLRRWAYLLARIFLCFIFGIGGFFIVVTIITLNPGRGYTFSYGFFLPLLMIILIELLPSIILYYYLTRQNIRNLFENSNT